MSFVKWNDIGSLIGSCRNFVSCLTYFFWFRPLQLNVDVAEYPLPQNATIAASGPVDTADASLKSKSKKKNRNDI
jgi:hypothetical protein